MDESPVAAESGGLRVTTTENAGLRADHRSPGGGGVGAKIEGDLDPSGSAKVAELFGGHVASTQRIDMHDQAHDDFASRAFSEISEAGGSEGLQDGGLGCDEGWLAAEHSLADPHQKQVDLQLTEGDLLEGLEDVSGIGGSLDGMDLSKVRLPLPFIEERDAGGLLSRIGPEEAARSGEEAGEKCQHGPLAIP